MSRMAQCEYKAQIQAFPTRPIYMYDPRGADGATENIPLLWIT